MESTKLVVHPARESAPLNPMDAAWRTAARPEGSSVLLERAHLLMKRRWTIIATVVIVVVLTTVASFKMVPKYKATGLISVNKENQEVLGFKEVTTTASDDYEDYTVALDTQSRIIESDTLAMQVIHDLGLEHNPRFAGKLATPAPSGKSSLQAPPDDVKRQHELLGLFRKSLDVKAVPRTRILEISFLSPDPVLSADVVNTLINDFVETNFKAKYESTMQTSEWLSTQLVELQRKVETSQEQLVRYERENDILGIDDKQNIITSKLSELNTQLTNAEGDRAQKEANYRLTLSGNPELLPGVSDNKVIQHLKEQQADLQRAYSEATTKFGPSYPRVVELKNQIASVEVELKAEYAKIASRVQNEFTAAQSRERLLRGMLDQQKIEANKLNERAIQYNLLKRDVDSNRQLYEGLLQKLKEATVSAGLKSGNIRVVDRARVPVFPSVPNIPFNIAVAFLVSIVAGVGLAFLIDAIDNTVRSVDEIVEVTTLPSLGVIPQAKEIENEAKAGRKQLPKLTGQAVRASQLLSNLQPKSRMAEAYRSLRTSILLSSPAGPPKVILVSSPLPQEGKTTTAANCAAALAQKGARVLLVDADLRRPALHQVFGISNSVGLSTVITNQATFASCISQPAALPTMKVLPAGPGTPYPAELLASEAMHKLIAEWRQEFDHVVIDTPPVLAVTDPVLLSADADAILLVVRAGKTTKQALRRATSLLRQVNARILGVVMNGINVESAEHYYSYYGYYSGGGGAYGGYYSDEVAAGR